MMKTNQYFHQQFAQYDDNDSRYREANQVLYRMVQEWPEPFCKGCIFVKQ